MSEGSPSWEIRTGDCIAKMKEMEAKSVKLVATDPPYNQGVEYDGYNDRRDRYEYLAWCRS